MVYNDLSDHEETKYFFRTYVLNKQYELYNNKKDRRVEKTGQSPPQKEGIPIDMEKRSRVQKDYGDLRIRLEKIRCKKHLKNS